jgi:hypothetical protein
VITGRNDFLVTTNLCEGLKHVISMYMYPPTSLRLVALTGVVCELFALTGVVSELFSINFDIHGSVHRSMTEWEIYFPLSLDNGRSPHGYIKPEAARTVWSF